MLNTFGVDAKKIVDETVSYFHLADLLKGDNMKFYTVNYDCWSARDKKKFLELYEVRDTFSGNVDSGEGEPNHDGDFSMRASLKSTCARLKELDSELT